MALCLANSLVARQGYVPYDQLVRYKWWYRDGYMSSTGRCFDIGAATQQSLREFERRQREFAKTHRIPLNRLDFLSDPDLLKEFNVNCSEEGVAGNGALMRLAPVPLFFYKDPAHAVEYSGLSGLITHGDEKAYDACRYYGALIVAAVNGATKEELVDKKFYEKNKKWFGNRSLHPDIEKIAQGSYQKGGYDKGIRGKGYIVDSLEAALWAFWSDNGSFRDGVLAAVNLGDDTDTTAAIYGQLAGAHYGYKNLPEEWKKEVYAKKFIQCLSKWIVYEGANWSPDGSKTSEIASATINVPFNQPKTTLNEPSVQERNTKYQPQLSTKQSDSQAACTTKLEQSIDPATGHRLQNPNFSKTSEAQRQNSVQHQNTRPSSHRKNFRFVTIY
ncbi:unnamed protein product [Rotaria sp. Silwood1]|nr:unnamed protein product [Rotaria sp. Silwood1]CAF3798833.1 unnamed protein product [Rotaria sp. Silwood1]CAF3839617.1 unnamed protein product [Rotaria sp. Silwood1]